jgi:hypothetical protein
MRQCGHDWSSGAEHKLTEGNLKEQVKKQFYAKIEHFLAYSGSSLSCCKPDYVFDDIENSITAAVKENNISVENDSLPIVW